MRGPHADPDFLTEADMELLFSRPGRRPELQPHRYPARVAPFQWARSSGGIAGGHPSNILDNSYPSARSTSTATCR